MAVHPEDPRYTAFVGKELEHPFFPDRKMVVVADPMVDREFGTGCVKITPAHDHNDFQCGKRHNLAAINVFGEDGNINHNGGLFASQHRFLARRTVEDALKEKGLWVGQTLVLTHNSTVEIDVVGAFFSTRRTKRSERNQCVGRRDGFGWMVSVSASSRASTDLELCASWLQRELCISD